MTQRDIVAIGASAGGVEALIRLVGGLPAELHAALFVVLHMSPDARSALPNILSRNGPLPAINPQDGEAIRHGMIYVARPNWHLLLERGRVRVLPGPRENGARPAIDPLFRSAAWAYGERVMGVVLSGTLDDGASGLQVIHRSGGLAVVQDPQDALFPGMPVSALDAVRVDHRLPADAIGPLIATLAHQTEPPPLPAHAASSSSALPATLLDVSSRTPSDTRSTTPSTTPRNLHARSTAMVGPDSDFTPRLLEPLPPGEDQAHVETGAPPKDLLPEMHKRDGQASGLTCPECNGSLWEAQDGEVLRYECRVNHKYTFDTLVASKAQEVEAAIWAAVNALEERASLSHKYAVRSRQRGNTAVAQRFLEQAQEAEHHAGAIRRTLLDAITILGDGSQSLERPVSA